MTPERYARVCEIFLELVRAPAEERASKLSRSCAGDAALEEEVRSLLVEHGRFEQAPVRPPSSTVSLPTALGPGERVAGYRIAGVLGTGGMGVVYLAEQEQLHRQVALKLLPQGLSSPAAERRFAREIEILARLHHPGIAQIYDAGVVDRGQGPQPYFAMELLRGPSLLEHVRRKEPTLEQRIELLIRISEAVHYAHGQGVVHRDLKPANILVEEPDLPKVLDFGIALSTDRDLELTTQTTEGAVLGTLAYMAPEQLAGDRAGVDARTDVYALGVIAYELFAGRPPTEVRGRPFAQALLALTLGEPPSLGRVDRRLKGDLETIVAKAMEKQSSRRYASARELSDDLDRYLHAEPIRARPTTTLYRISRFARRNRMLVRATSAVFAVLIGGLWATSWQAARATAEQKRTLAALGRAEAAEKRANERADQYRASSGFIEGILSAIDPDELGREALVLDALDKASRDLASGTPLPLHVQASIDLAIGTSYQQLGVLERAREHLERALACFRKTEWTEPLEMARAAGALGGLYGEEERFDAAEPLLRESLDTTTSTLGPEDDETLIARLDHAQCLLALGQLDRAESEMRSVVEIARRTSGEQGVRTLHALLGLSDVLGAREAHAERTEVLETILAAAERRDDLPYRVLSTARLNLASAYRHLGRLDEGIEMVEEAFEEDRDRLGPENPSTLTKLNNLATFLAEAGEVAAAAELIQEVADLRRKVLRSTHPDTIAALTSLCRIRFDLGQRSESEALEREILTLLPGVQGGVRGQVLDVHATLVRLRVEAGRGAEALELARELDSLCERHLAAGHWRCAYSRVLHALCLAIMNRYEEAEEKMLPAMAELELALGRKNLYVQESRLYVEALYARWGRPNRAQISPSEATASTRSGE